MKKIKKNSVVIKKKKQLKKNVAVNGDIQDSVQLKMPPVIITLNGPTKHER